MEEVRACTDCGLCVESCPTYKVTGSSFFSPSGRLKTSSQIFEGGDVDEKMLESIYNCPKCMLCEEVCPEQIKVTRVVHKTREELVRRGIGPLDKHKKVIEGILKNGNAVNGDPEKRLEWLPEEFSQHESETLLYLGCLPSYLVKDAARSSYLVLKKLGFDFMILEDEGCCGTYIYESGRTDLAGEFFRKNVERFKTLGIKEIVVPCNGCLKCFKYFYPDLLGEMEFSVRHVVEVMYEILKRDPEILRKKRRMITYHDSCRLARGEGIIEEPRKILEWCGVELHDIDTNGENAACCGAGGGIRSIYRDLSLDIAVDVLNKAPTEMIASACPFCAFNLNYASSRRELNKSVRYLTTIVLEALD